LGAACCPPTIRLADRRERAAKKKGKRKRRFAPFVLTVLVCFPGCPQQIRKNSRKEEEKGKKKEKDLKVPSSLEA